MKRAMAWHCYSAPLPRTSNRSVPSPALAFTAHTARIIARTIARTTLTNYFSP